MRRRPDVQLLLRPGVAIPGREFVAEAVLDSKSETPVDAIEMTLRGIETIGVPHRGQGRVVTHEHVARRARFPARILGPGRHRVAARFALPTSAPPSYVGSSIAVEYVLEVHVAIPWWPDRRARYVVPVALPVASPLAPRPQVYCNTQGGPRGKEPYVELALDDARIAPGATLSGAVSFANVAHARIRRIELQFVTSEHVRFGPHEAEYGREGKVWSSRLLDRAPNEGEAVPFRIRFPSDATPAFRSASSRVEYGVAVVAVVAFGKDVRLEIPIEVVPKAPSTKPARLGAVPPVGRARHALVLRAAAKRLDLEVDESRDELRSTAATSTLIVRLEHRAGVGLLAVAELAWAALGLELEVRERRFADAFAGDTVDLGESPFGKRFVVRAADRDAVTTLLDEDVRAGLLAFDDVEIDDAGARLARAVSVQSADALAADLRPILETARVVAEARVRMPDRHGAPYR